MSEPKILYKKEGERGRITHYDNNTTVSYGDYTKKKKMASKMVKVMGHAVKEGSKKHSRLMQDKKRYDDLANSEH